MKKTYFWMAVLAFVFSACSKKLESCFTYTVASGTVSFNSGCAENATEFVWDFGDGSTAAQPSPVHTYTAAGQYQVTLIVKDAKGKKSALSSQFVTIAAVPCNPACVNGLCVDGDCICNVGYEGVDCATAYNAKFSGNYSLTETCSPSGVAGPYAVVVGPKSGTVVEATFVGLWESSGPAVTAVIGSSGLSFTIARQVIIAGYDLESSYGVITPNGATINLTYRIYATGGSSILDACTATLAR